MVKSFILAAAVAAAAAPAAIPDKPHAAAGEWRLSDVAGKIACTLVLSEERVSAGLAVRAPLACRRGFPALKDLAAWSLDAQGAIVFSDPGQQRLAVFTPQPGAPYEAKSPGGKTWRLERTKHASQFQSARERMSGAFRLSSAGGAVLCELTLTANLLGNAGSVTPVQCAPPWNEKAFAVWSLKDGRLTLFDKTRKTLLVMLKSESADSFVAGDPKADAVTLARK